ncbi:MAG: hypothetical protein K2O35_02010 [Clostridia bacterium]|nr:hypothetical protein [Clostridia bacterium]
MNGFEFAVNVLSIIASGATIIACIPIFVAFVNYLRNLVSSKRLKISTLFRAGFGSNPDNFEIELQNQTNRKFYITKIHLIICGKEIELLKEILPHNETQFSPIEIAPYQITTIKGMCNIHSVCDENTHVILAVSIPGKCFYYDTLLKNKQSYNAHHRKYSKNNSKNNNSNK